MPDLKVARLVQCLFSRTEEYVLDRTDGISLFLMVKCYLCYWNIWSLSAVDFSRTDCEPALGYGLCVCLCSVLHWNKLYKRTNFIFGKHSASALYDPFFVYQTLSILCFKYTWKAHWEIRLKIEEEKKKKKKLDID